jgi:hypothetical protein
MNGVGNANKYSSASIWKPWRVARQDPCKKQTLLFEMWWSTKRPGSRCAGDPVGFIQRMCYYSEIESWAYSMKVVEKAKENSSASILEAGGSPTCEDPSKQQYLLVEVWWSTKRPYTTVGFLQVSRCAGDPLLGLSSARAVFQKWSLGHI